MDWTPTPTISTTKTDEQLEEALKRSFPLKECCDLLEPILENDLGNPAKVTDPEKLDKIVSFIEQCAELGADHPVWVELRRRKKNGEFAEDFEASGYWDGTEENRAQQHKEWLASEEYQAINKRRCQLIASHTRIVKENDLLKEAGEGAVQLIVDPKDPIYAKRARSFIEKEEPRTIIMTAMSEEESRIYDELAELLAEQFGYQYRSSTSPTGEYRLWILSTPRASGDLKEGYSKIPNYRRADHKGERCDTCTHFIECKGGSSNGVCVLFDSIVSAPMVCDAYDFSPVKARIHHGGLVNDRKDAIIDVMNV